MDIGTLVRSVRALRQVLMWLSCLRRLIRRSVRGFGLAAEVDLQAQDADDDQAEANQVERVVVVHCVDDAIHERTAAQGKEEKARPIKW